MTLQECYESIGADYEGVMRRLLKEDRVTRFLGKFRADSMLEPLEKALEAKDFDEAFRAAHNLKGVCQNLGITKLVESSSDMTEALRHGEPEADVTPLLVKVKGCYEETMRALDETL